MAGIHIKEEHIDLFNKLKINKEFKALSFGLGPERNTVELFQTFPPETDHKEIIESLPNNDCRYLIYDFKYQTNEHPPRETVKLLLIHWAPDCAPIKVKVPFAATKSELKSTFVGIQKDIAASDLDILQIDEIRSECCS